MRFGERMRDELEVVRLKRDVEGISAGTVGTILVSSPSVPDRYLVEFVGSDITDVSIIDVHEDNLESVPARGRV